MLLVTLIFIVSPAMADKYVIDGDISDWGVDLANGFTNGQYPTDANEKAWYTGLKYNTVDWVVEDNRDPSLSSDYIGVHIYGVGTTKTSTYSEKLLHFGTTTIAYQPSGGEGWDIEALYFDDDEYYLYFAIVVSNNQLVPDSFSCSNGQPNYLGPGDLYLSVLTDSGWKEYGVVIKSHPNIDGDKWVYQGEVYENPSWYDDLYEQVCGRTGWNEVEKTLIDPENPGANIPNAAEVAIAQAPVSDNEYPNYIIEIKIDRTKIGYPKQGAQGPVEFAVSCGNDYIEKEITYNYNTIPEFTAIFIPAAIIIGSFYYFRMRRQ